jgi:hypothetical protein
MTSELEPVRPDGPIYRLGRSSDPWAWPDWAYAGEDGTFGNRYDDPRSEYRVLYASSRRLGALIETLARFRADPAIVSEQIASDPRDAQYETLRPGVVPERWFENRVLGEARCEGTFADVGHARSLAHLRSALAAEIVRHGLDDLDAAAIRARVPRAFTQQVSRYVYECTDQQGGRAFQGIGYLSRLGDDIGNWAIFEPAEIDVISSLDLVRGDRDLDEALSLLGLTLSA